MNYPLLKTTIIGTDSGGDILTAEDVLQVFLNAANDGEGLTHTILTSIHRDGITDVLVNKINEWMALRPRSVRPQLQNETRSITWVFDEPVNVTWLFEPSIKPQPDQFLSLAGWCTAVLISLDVFDQLKRCEVCSNFYIGGPRAKYCSDTCGSLNRVRRKRKKDRERQML